MQIHGLGHGHLQGLGYGHVRALIAGISIANAADARTTVSTIVACGLSIAFGWVTISQKFAEAKRERKRLDVEAALELQKETDVANHESLTGQLAAVQKTLDEAAAESQANQDRMRATLHQINSDLHTSRLETAEARAALAESSKACNGLGKLLAAANSTIAELHAATAPAAPRAPEGNAPHV